MVYYEAGNFKRYVRKVKNNSKNAKEEYREIQQLNVTGLSKKSKFKDGQKVIVMDYEEFKKLEDGISNNVETPNYANKVIELQDIINNRNQLLLNTQDTLNSLIEELTVEISDVYNSEIEKVNDVNKENIEDLIFAISEIANTFNEYNLELEKKVIEVNTNIDNSSWYKRAFSKDTFKINMDLSKLKELELKLKEINTVNITKDLIKPIEIPTDKINEIKFNAKSKDFDIQDLYITNTGNKDVIINSDEFKED